MRWLFALLLIVPVSLGMVVKSTGEFGSDFVLYGDLIAYERDGEVRVYNIARQDDSFLSNGSNPSLFAYTLVFENNGTVWYSNVRDRKVVDSGFKGKNPYVFSDVVVFSTSEKDLGVDFSNDGDLNDDILRQFDLKDLNVVNLKAVGDFPVFNQRAVLFLTKEDQLNVDLNADGDKFDDILRILDRQSRQVGNLKVESSKPVISKNDKAVFSSNGKISVLDVKEQKVSILGKTGQNPSISEDVVVYEDKGALYGYSLDDNSFAKIAIFGSKPSFFEDVLVVLSDERGSDGKNFIIKYAREEDADGDDISDFVDDCPLLAGLQNDGDGNGVGDGCDVNVKKEEVRKPSVTSPNGSVLDDGNQENSESKFSFGWYWLLLLLIPFLPYLIRMAVRYHKKRKKSFGF